MAMEVTRILDGAFGSTDKPHDSLMGKLWIDGPAQLKDKGEDSVLPDGRGLWGAASLVAKLNPEGEPSEMGWHLSGSDVRIKFLASCLSAYAPMQCRVHCAKVPMSSWDFPPGSWVSRWRSAVDVGTSFHQASSATSPVYPTDEVKKWAEPDFSLRAGIVLQKDIDKVQLVIMGIPLKKGMLSGLPNYSNHERFYPAIALWRKDLDFTPLAGAGNGGMPIWPYLMTVEDETPIPDTDAIRSAVRKFMAEPDGIRQVSRSAWDSLTTGENAEGRVAVSPLPQQFAWPVMAEEDVEDDTEESSGGKCEKILKN